MTYPVFAGQTFSYNYINEGDCFDLAKNLTNQGNPYGLNSTLTDSHLTKNSEWGALTYLAWSQYGLDNSKFILKNNLSLNNSISTVYSVTGYADFSSAQTAVEYSGDTYPLPEEIDGQIFAWYTEQGQKASCTKNLSGVFDLSGCTREFVSAYRELENDEYVTDCTKYKTYYPAQINNLNPNYDGGHHWFYGSLLRVFEIFQSYVWLWRRDSRNNFFV